MIRMVQLDVEKYDQDFATQDKMGLTSNVAHSDIISHETTGFHPLYLMFGQVPNPHLPAGVLFKSTLGNDSEVSFPLHVEELRNVQ